jgi:hypothetical protein
VKSRQVIEVGLAFAGFAFLYSFLGFLNNQGGGAAQEYSLGSLSVEIGGHMLFGAIAAIPFLDLELIVLTSFVAVLIDTDHILRFLSFPVTERPDHSIMFLVASAALLAYLGQKMNLKYSEKVKVAALAPVAILSHFSYDVFAAYRFYNGGFTFPVFYPFSFALIPFPFDSFYAFEIAAIAVAAIATLIAMLRKKQKIVAIPRTDSQQRG